jgi:hypothetical protein
MGMTEISKAKASLAHRQAGRGRPVVTRRQRFLRAPSPEATSILHLVQREAHCGAVIFSRKLISKLIYGCRCGWLM